MPFMTKDLSKEIMERSRRRNKFLKDKSLKNRMLHKTTKELLCISFKKD